MVKLVIGVLFLRLVFQLMVSAVDVERLNIWPMPQSVSYGHQVLYVSKEFELRTEGSKYPDASGILKDGFSRLLYVINAPQVADGNISHLQQSLVLQGINVLISSPNDELQYGIDESYKLSVTSSGDPVNARLGLQYGIDESYKSSVVSSGDSIYAHLEAKTVYGALHGLQTFSQLCLFNFSTRLIEVHQAPWYIRDQPRFSYRGLLIDTARHYQPLEMIKKVVDSMAYAKLNVLHWHIVDSQSFPLEIPSYSKLWNGAFSISERYSMADAAEVVSYAQRRGINVLAEIDVPGHAQSWGTGYPTLWPSHDCQQPLDVSNEFTFQVIDGILSDFSKVFKFKFVHLGGDEVNTSCWVTTPRVKNWLEKHGMNESEAYEYFVLRAQKIALSHGYECVNWEETFNNFGDKLNRKTVVHNWLGGGVAQRVVASGLRCIVSNQDKWYLDHLDTTWSEFYSNEPLTKITDPKQQELVMGGEVCMWGERVDSSDIEQTIWPRAAAAAERLWTPYEKLAKDPRKVTGRLAHFRCLLNQRGVAAAPLAAPGRGAPLEPGSCYEQ